jgi:hypothetical protein
LACSSGLADWQAMPGNSLSPAPKTSFPPAPARSRRSTATPPPARVYAGELWRDVRVSS